MLLTTPAGSSGEVAGGLCAHQHDFGASGQEKWRQQVLKAFPGHPLSEREGADQSHTLEQQVPANHCSRFSTQSRGQEKQAPAGGGGGLLRLNTPYGTKLML